MCVVGLSKVLRYKQNFSKRDSTTKKQTSKKTAVVGIQKKRKSTGATLSVIYSLSTNLPVYKKRSNLYICFVLYTSMQAENFSNIKLINFRSLSPRKASYNSHASQPPVYISLEQYACALKKKTHKNA